MDFDSSDYNDEKSWEETEEEALIKETLKAGRILMQEQQNNLAKLQSNNLFWTLFSGILQGHIARGVDNIDRELIEKCYKMYRDTLDIYNEMIDDRKKEGI